MRLRAYFFIPCLALGCASVPQSFSEQVRLGAPLYKENCARCHGAGGEGSPKGPRVVGLSAGALPLDPPKEAKHRKLQFKTVADVAGFAVSSMPPNEPGSLSAEEYLAILAFDLKANGIDLKEQKLTLELAKSLVIPR